MNDLVVVEYLAIRWALELAKIWGIRKTILETDCSRVVVEFVNLDPSSPLHGLVADVADLASSMEYFSLAFSPKSCNKVAHGLAKLYSGP